MGNGLGLLLKIDQVDLVVVRGEEQQFIGRREVGQHSERGESNYLYPQGANDIVHEYVPGELSRCLSLASCEFFCQLFD